MREEGPINPHFFNTKQLAQEEADDRQDSWFVFKDKAWRAYAAGGIAGSRVWHGHYWGCELWAGEATSIVC